MACLSQLICHLYTDEINLNLLSTPQVNLLTLLYWIVTNWTYNPGSTIIQMHVINHEKASNEWPFKLRMFYCSFDNYIYDLGCTSLPVLSVCLCSFSFYLFSFYLTKDIITENMEDRLYII